MVLRVGMFVESGVVSMGGPFPKAGEKGSAMVCEDAAAELVYGFKREIDCVFLFFLGE